MANVFRNDKERAAAYAAYKMLERLLEKDGQLPSGFYQDLTNDKVEITFPKGTVVERDRGTNGDGSYFKTATQNLYGFAFWQLMIGKLTKFHQWNMIRQIIMDAVRDCLTNKSTVQEELVDDQGKKFLKEIEELRASLPTPQRKEQTPRLCKDPGLPPTVTFRWRN